MENTQDEFRLKLLQAEAERDSLKQHLAVALRHISRAQCAGLPVDDNWLVAARIAAERG